MAEQVKIKFKNLNVDNFIDYIENSNIKEKQVIDIYSDKLYSKGHNLNKTFVKYTEIETSSIFGSIEFPENFSDQSFIVLPFNDLKKILEMAKIYKINASSSQINGEITCKFDEQQNKYIGQIIQFKSAKMSTKLNLGEVSMIQYLPNAIWQKISDNSSYQVKFGITSDGIEEILKLFKFENEITKNTVKEVKKFIVEFGKTENTVVFKSFEGKWETKYDVIDGKAESIDLVFSNLILDKMDKSKAHVFYLIKSPVNGQFCLIVEEEGSQTKYLTIGQKYDKNMK